MNSDRPDIEIEYNGTRTPVSYDAFVHFHQPNGATLTIDIDGDYVHIRATDSRGRKTGLVVTPQAFDEVTVGGDVTA